MVVHPMISPLSLPASDADVQDLAELLVDAVAAGAAVSFLSPLAPADAIAWWQETLAGLAPRAVVLVARSAEGIVGTVQFQPAWARNQPHRAEVVKLLVHRRARRQGLGRALMVAIEAAARAAGFGLLTLDTKGGDPAEQLYRDLGWIAAGTIPGFAVDPDGVTPHDAVVFYKPLR